MARWYRLGMVALFLLAVLGADKGSSLEGQVVDGKGQPMAKIKIIATQEQPVYKGYDKFETTTDGDGKFAFAGLFPMATYKIVPYLDNQTTSVRLKVESVPEGLTKMLPGPMQIRFTKGKDGVIVDSATGLEWYVGPERDTNWNQAQAWTASLTVAGGGWRMPTILELKALYQQGAGPNNMDPLFEITGPWIWSGQRIDTSSAMGFYFDSGQEEKGTLDYASIERAFAVRSRR